MALNRQSHLFLRYFLLPVFMVAGLALLLNAGALFSLKQHQAAGFAVVKTGLGMLNEAMRISADMAAMQVRVGELLKRSAGGELDEGAIYRVHAEMVEELAGLSGRVEALTAAMSAVPAAARDGAALRTDFESYRNHVLMATDIAGIDPTVAGERIGAARDHFVAFSKRAHHIGARMGEQVGASGEAATAAFEHALSQSLVVVAGGLLAILALGWLAARTLAGRLTLLTNGLSSLARAAGEPPPLSAVERIAVDPRDSFHEIADAILSFRRSLVERQRLEAALRESADVFRDMLETSPIAARIASAGGREVIFFNRRYAELVNLAPGEVAGLDPGAYYTRREDYEDIVRRLEQGEKVFDRLVEIAVPGHGSKWALASYLPIQYQGTPAVLGWFYDITGRKQAEEQLRQSASVFEHANEGIMITDPEGSILDVNAAFCRITGYPRDEVLGRNPRMFKSSRHGPEFYAAMWRALKETGQWSGEIWDRRKDGGLYAKMATISAVRGEHGEVQRYVSLFSDISVIKEHQHQLERIAHFDALTGLPNRVLLADRLHQAMAQAGRRQIQVAVAYLDLDGFKAINDSHGHEAGDRLLIQLAGRMSAALREGDTLSRLGGDEFVAVLIDLASSQDSIPILDRLLQAAAAPVWIDGVELRVSASLGVSFFPQAGAPVDADQLLRQADQAMYQAKQAGKNRYHLFDAERDRALRGHHESLERVRLALENREFVLHYQPKVNMRTGEVIGAEALMRWKHPERGLLAPADFLPVIENHPLSVEVGEWVFASAIDQTQAWRRVGLRLPVSVNVDALQLQQSDFIERLRANLARHPDLQPGDLELEILETSALEDIARVSHVIYACRELGVEFALDDFGTGYSSLAYLKRLPVQQLKIDQSFVRNMLEDPDDLAILDGIVGLAEAFQRQVLAEGVETPAHGKLLLRLGCELGQGYAIARPMPAEAVAGWVATWQPETSWRNCPRVGRTGLPFLYAMAGHRAWVTALGRHLRDEQPALPSLDHHQRRCGEWFDVIGAKLPAGDLDIAHIRTLHEAVYRQANALLDLKQRGCSEDARARLPEVETLLDALLERLEALIGAGPV